MILALTSKNKISFVDGTLTRPFADDTSHKTWIRCNNMVIGWIISNISTLIGRGVHNLQTTREIWIDK